MLPLPRRQPAEDADDGHPTQAEVLPPSPYLGAIHLDGVPGGALGAAMAAVWGVVLGIVRHRTGSIRTVWVVHVLANVAIFTTVTTLAFRDGVL